MKPVYHDYFFVHSDLVQRRYECIREVHLGLRVLHDSLKIYGLSLEEYNDFNALYCLYSSTGLVGLKVGKIDKPKCRQHDIKNAVYINKRYGKENIAYMKCPVCDHIFSSKQGTAIYRSHIADKEYCQIITALSEGTGIRATGRIFGIDKDTTLRLLKYAAAHCRKVSQHFLKDLNIEECQIDELWSFVMKKEKNLTPIEETFGTFGDQWIWVCIDAVHKIIASHVVGKHTFKNSVTLLQGFKQVTNDHMPFFTSDELPHYPNALLRVYGIEKKFPLTHRVGRPRLPRLIPSPSLHYAQVVKTRRKGRIVNIQYKVIYGNEEDIKERLKKSTVSNSINTAFVERVNGTLRHIDKRLCRKTYCFSKNIKYHKDQLDLSLAYYHLIKPHRGLSSNHNAKKGGKKTPFFSAGLTDHIWTMNELLTYKVA